MGRDERDRRAMTLEARKEVDAHNERIMGPPLAWGAHDEACPACGTPKMTGETLNRVYHFCPGHVETLPDQVEQPCGTPGFHLDVACKTCSRVWRTVCYEEREAGPKSPLEP